MPWYFSAGPFRAAFAAGLIVASLPAVNFPVRAAEGILPPAANLNETAIELPREIFHSEASGGKKPYMATLGDMAFGSPAILGPAARRAGISCETCHVEGANNAQFYIPGMSTRPGTFDTTGPLFNPKADDGVFDVLTIPSLRGARSFAPYGHNGRTASLRDFVRNVIVVEFGGDEPAPDILDAIVIYIQDIDLLPNPRLGLAGQLDPKASKAERRGEALFHKPFPGNAAMSCATCHNPSAGFADREIHDIGSGGMFKTPTLLNANFNAPYFHDGRFDSYSQVVGYFNGTFSLKLSAKDQSDLVAYLEAVGDGEQPFLRASPALAFAEIDKFASLLDTAIPAKEASVVALAVDAVDREIRELTERFPERKNPIVRGGENERAQARAALKELVLGLRRIETAASAGNFDEAKIALDDYRVLQMAAVPLAKAAAPYSLFDPNHQKAYLAALEPFQQAMQR